MATLWVKKDCRNRSIAQVLEDFKRLTFLKDDNNNNNNRWKVYPLCNHTPVLISNIPFFTPPVAPRYSFLQPYNLRCLGSILWPLTWVNRVASLGTKMAPHVGRRQCFNDRFTPMSDGVVTRLPVTRNKNPRCSFLGCLRFCFWWQKSTEQQINTQF